MIATQYWRQIQWINYPTIRNSKVFCKIAVDKVSYKTRRPLSQTPACYIRWIKTGTALYRLHHFVVTLLTKFLKRRVQFRIWSIEDKLIYGGVEFLREIYFDWIHCAQQFVLIWSDCEGSHHWRVQDLVNGQFWYACLANRTYLLHHISLWIFNRVWL